ncbi:hypothetical protein B0I35DRAFT_405500 [Stachybotrys elegans]|uniref:Zn(2)-C6 fungal-type domain-containing protein n=1 Tax=Stachybotrys elegans TaxID=80388 RepID=A0A8K0SZN9_9HYPO|nr:hypothetical protein B0I35DRAFT_405500 [Stachybotrys elegans]
MASKHPLRRSCAFCRARKIKCSNETICEACRKQGADCIYDFEPPRPKARGMSQDRVHSDRDATPFSQRQRQSRGASPIANSGVAMTEEMRAAEQGENVALVLEQKFYENFSPDFGPRRSPWHDRIAAYKKGAQRNTRERNDSSATTYSPMNVKYTGILSLLTHDLVGLVTDQFGSLGCYHVEEGGAKFFLSGLASDETQTMFDDQPLGGNPLSEYGQRQQTQLIDVWYSSHPLSFLVSKTLLLRQIRDGTHDEVLLAVMLADANFSIGDEVASARGQVLLRWAAAQLRTRSLQPKNQTGGMSGTSTRIFSGISVAQALMLLGWNAMCASQARRAICYIGLAGKIATEIQEQIASATGPMTSSRINGIDVFDVEKELVSYLYWTTFSLTLWAFIQMGNGKFPAMLQSLTSVFLPVTEASSAVIQLDIVSENFSTLHKQKAVIREMWPLAHIVSVIGYIYAMCPQSLDNSESPTTSFWQDAPLLALHRFQQGKPAPDVNLVCRNINQILLESINILTRQVSEVQPRSLVLLVYHTMAIHFLFPALPQGQGEVAITPDILDRFCSSTHEILRMFAVVSGQPHDNFSFTSSLRPCFPDVFRLALDTCARGLYLLDARSMLQSSTHGKNLATLTQGLYAMSRDDFFNQGSSLRMVKRQLKACLRTIHGRTPSTSSSSGASSPDYSRGSVASIPQSPVFSPPLAGSSVDSDHMSTASTTVLDPSSSFISPMDATSIPHPMASSVPSSRAPSLTDNPFSPLSDLHKSDWRANEELYHNVLEPSAHHLTLPGMVEMQGGWYQHHAPGVMDFEMAAGPMSNVQWNWGDADSEMAVAATSGGSDLYYCEGKRP